MQCCAGVARRDAVMRGRGEASCSAAPEGRGELQLLCQQLAAQGLRGSGEASSRAAQWQCATPCRHGGGRDVAPLLVVFLLFPALLLPSSAAHSAEATTLSVGEELVGETMPLRHGRRVYRIDGLRPSAWYEVKISYPASIPSSFTIRLVDDPDAAENFGSRNRRLLNTEKIIFKAESSDPVYVLVTVEPEGVVAKPNVPERELTLFNIVCDELMLGIPHFAWWVGIGALLCIVLALLAPLFLPLHKLLNYEPKELSSVDTTKMS